MDPVFSEPFESSSNGFDPPIETDSRTLARRCSLAILSHSHWDHFDPRTLVLLDRHIPIVYPRGDELIERCLARLGFEAPRPVAPGEQLSTTGLRLIPTPSHAPFLEMGMVFVEGKQVFWNLVDSGIDDSITAWVRKQVQHFDLLFAKFQPLIERELVVNSLGSDFPLARYSALLRNVWSIAPRAVAPASCGYRYTRAQWLNDRGFPITEAQFEEDLRLIMPDLQVIHVNHGGSVQVEPPFRVDPNGIPEVKRLTPALRSSFDWRPERGVPPLRDSNRWQLPISELRTRCTTYLDEKFLSNLAAEDPAWLARMARLGCVWRLEIVYPQGAPELRALDMRHSSLRWSSPDEGVFAKIHTSITGSALVGLLEGRCNAYSLNFNDLRIMERLYMVHAGGASRGGTDEDEPLTRVLIPGADRRYLDRLLDELLDGGSSKS